MRSSANTAFGYGVTMYMVLFAMIGAASCPRTNPVENVATTWSRRTVVVSISVNPLNRVDA